MRLIRKDYAQDIVINESKKHSGFEFCYKPVYDKITDCVEVDAIPIEWIEDFLKKFPKDIEYLIEPKSMIGNMINQYIWEKENENN